MEPEQERRRSEPRRADREWRSDEGSWPEHGPEPGGGQGTERGRVLREEVAAPRGLPGGRGEPGNAREPSGGHSGGQMSNRPPSNVKSGESVRVLASGIDTLNLAVDLMWRDSQFLDGLWLVKEKAGEYEESLPYPFCDKDGVLLGVLNVQSYGVRGYEWVLSGADFSMRLGDWLVPTTRPSAMVEIGSEALWRLGARGAVDRVRQMIASTGAEIAEVKTSRADLCVDILAGGELWGEDLLRYAVCRARLESIYRNSGRLGTIALGRGKIMARLYDKAAEMAKSGKGWMVDVWGIQSVPPGKRAVRVEFQLRREALKSLGINGIEDLFRNSGRVWAYCTENWLKFQDQPDAHHTQRECLPWWKTVQRGFNGGQGATPAVRAKAVEWDRKQLMAQAVGVIGTLAALEATERHGVAPTGEEILESFEDVVRETKEIGCGSQDLPEVVRSKVAQFQRTRAAHEAAVRNRNAQEQEENRQ